MLLTLLLVLLLFGGYFFARGLWVPVMQKIVGKKTVEAVIQRYGKPAREQLIPLFTQAGVTYPPQQVTLLAMKAEKRLELWANNGDTRDIFIRAYPIQQLSGVAGPKLREGDRQVPEGEYSIIGLNPNSAYHLSMKLNYPNAFDLLQANKAGRDNPGSNIFIHGKSVSIGCLAMGDESIEALFVLSHDVGINNIRVVIAPHDPRSKALKYDDKNQPKWVAELYGRIEKIYAGYSQH